MARATLSSFNQIIVFTTTNLAGCVGFLVYYLPNTVFLERLKEFTSMYRNLEALTVSEYTEKIVKDVMDEKKLTENEQDEIEFYHICGLKPMCYGSTWKIPVLGGFTRGIIGLPVTFDQNDDNFYWKDLMFDGIKIDWTNKAALALKESLTLTEKAKKFVIAQQLYHVSTCETLFKSIITGAICLVTVTLSRTLNLSGNLYARSRALRFSMYSVVVMFNSVVWVFAKDVMQCNMQYEADKHVASLGKEYVEGGLEYYEKQLQSNQYIRQLTGEKGEKLFTLFGNENTLFRQKNLPLTHRRDFFKKILAEQYS